MEQEAHRIANRKYYESHAEQIKAKARRAYRPNPSIFGGRPPETPADAGNAVKRDFAREAAKTPSPHGCDGIARQKKMNKTEARAAAWLRLNGYADIIAQPTRLFPLAGGGSYTPDFLAWVPGEPGVLVVEVKGGYRGPGWEQGYERYRRAALQYSCHDPWRFALLTWHARRREWTFEECMYKLETSGE